MKFNSQHIKQFKTALEKEGLRFTKQRFIIFKFLISNEGHYSCDDISKIINAKGYNVSRATLYRTVDLLVKYNFVRKLVLDDGVALYENKIFIEHHDHMIDIETNQIIEFVDEDIERIQNNIAKKHGYKIVKHVHQLFVKKNK